MTQEDLSSQFSLTSTKLTRKFYEPVLLLVGLNSIFKDKTSRKATEVPCDSNLELEDIYRGLQCKLGQACDSRPHGLTVTSFTVLQKPDGIQYVFASNKRSIVELETTKAYITAILKCLGDAEWEKEDEQDNLNTRLLNDILLFNLPRIRMYLGSLANELSKCVSICTNEETPQERLERELRNVLEVVAASIEEGLEDEDFLSNTVDVIEAIRRIRQSNIYILIQKRASDEAANNTKPWREIRHIFGRLLSYSQIVEILFMSRHIWPQLFCDFEVTYIPSSRPHPNPLLLSPLSSETIVGRISPSEEKDKYLHQIQALPQRALVDEAVVKQWTNPKFRPYVHAEILLLNWLENTGGTRPARFFNNWAYIGCSKPTCRLCDYYFACHPSGVETRGAHGNLYPQWRFPDSPDMGGETGDIAVRTRQTMMQTIAVRLRNEILRVVRDGVTSTRTHDSNTYSLLACDQDPDVVAGTSNEIRAQASSELDSGSGGTSSSPGWKGIDADADYDGGNDSGMHE